MIDEHKLLHSLEVTIPEYAARKIFVDSDGNRHRIAYREGAATAAARAAASQFSRDGRLAAILYVLEKHEIVVD